MMQSFYLTILFTLASLPVFAQQNNWEWFLNANINAYLPGRNSAKSVFPVLGYNRNTSPKIMLGGVGTGFFIWKPVAKDVHLKTYANLSKLTYWDDPVVITTGSGMYNGTLNNWSSDYVLGIGGIVHYDFAPHLSIGAGLGTQFLLISLSRMPEMNGYGLAVEPSIVINHYYKTLLPIIPLEIAYKLKRMMISLRYDTGILNKLRGDLGKNKSEKFGVLGLDVAVKLR